MFKSPEEYAALILQFTGGNRIESIKVLFEAAEIFRFPENYLAAVLNIITGK